jgi:LacI family transcriptional regulator
MLLNVKTVHHAPPTFRRVALLLDTAVAYQRGLLQGIARYNRERGNWFSYFHATPASALQQRVGRLDGMLVGVDADIASLARQTGAACVGLYPTQANTGVAPYLGPDNEQIARLAAQHLLDRGVEHYAFCGGRRSCNPALTVRAETFCQIIEQAGHVCYSYAGTPDSSEQGQERLAAWITAQPKPLGIMVANDLWGFRVLDACRLAGVSVPDQVAVIGVDNDPLCELVIPPLSTVDVNSEGIGFEAAAMLDRMMHGETVPAGPTLLAPRGVITRRSSDVVASEDEEVNRAVRFIRERACCAVGLQVDDVLGYTGMSRATLQQRMKKLLGHTIHQEIQRARLSKAKELLAMSGMTIKQVARESGFASVQYMTRVFRAGTGETPARYRLRRSV